jgi:hypothetical protein
VNKGEKMMFPYRSPNIDRLKLFAGFIIAIISLAASDRLSIPEQPGDKIDWYNKYFPMENVFLHTDKYLYEAGETVWFKGYVASLNDERKPLYSNDIYIKLLDQQNEELIYRRYPIVNNTVSGYISLPKSTIKGKYYLVAYTSWMKNSDPVRFFSKELVVVKNNKRRIIADLKLLGEECCISDTFTALLNVRNQTGEPVGDASVSYSIQGLDKTIKQGNSITDPSGIAQIKDVIPRHKVREACFIKVIISSKQGTGKYIFPLPVAAGDVQLSFNSAQPYLLKGCENRIRFRTVTGEGIPVCCEGEIINPSGKAVLSFKSSVNGTGEFTFVPQESFYRARIIIPPGDSLYLLPPVFETGIFIDYEGIINHALSFSVKVSPGNIHFRTSWLASSFRREYWSSSLEINNEMMVNVPLPENREELIQVSVFNEKGELLYDNLMKGQSMTRPLRVVTNKSRYGKREQITAEIMLEEKNRFSGSLDLSMSVTQKHLAENYHCQLIDEYMYYENRIPSVIFRSEAMDTNAFLFAGKPFPLNWEVVMKQPYESKERYYNRDGLTGIVYDKRKIPVGYAKVKAVNIANWKSYETQCDESGIFRVLFGSDIVDFNYLNINAFDASGKTTLWPSVDQDFSKAVNQSMMISEKDMAGQKTADIFKFPYPDILSSFQYPEKRKKSADREVKKISSPQQYVNYLSVMDIIMDLKPYDVINDQIFFKGIQKTYGSQTGALIIVDGILQGNHVNIIRNLTPPDIVYINILTTQAEIKRYTNLNYTAIIEIITVRGIAQNRMLPGLSGIDMLELNREFQSPDYSLEKSSKDDVRTTLYWNPGLAMPVEEGAMKVSFYSSDVTGTYIITIQGFDDEGNPVSAQTEFVVKDAGSIKIERNRLKIGKKK